MSLQSSVLWLIDSSAVGQRADCVSSFSSCVERLVCLPCLVCAVEASPCCNVNFLLLTFENQNGTHIYGSCMILAGRASVFMWREQRRSGANRSLLNTRRSVWWCCASRKEDSQTVSNATCFLRGAKTEFGLQICSKNFYLEFFFNSNKLLEWVSQDTQNWLNILAAWTRRSFCRENTKHHAGRKSLYLRLISA